MWTECVQLPAPGLRGLLPWVLIVAGFVAQFAGARLLVGGAWASWLRPALLAGRPTSPVEDSEDPPLLEVPIAGARVPTNPVLLPGARRAYRGGQHEGVDFSCHPGTPVLAAADGWVMSIDDEPDLPESRRDELLDYCRRLGKTPQEVLSVLHGRRVTLCHGMREGQLLTTNYSHLGAVGPGIRPGVPVRQGDLIGETGCSGTSHSYRNGPWAELHFEIRLDGHPLGLGRPPLEAAKLYRDLLGEGR